MKQPRATSFCLLAIATLFAHTSYGADTRSLYPAYTFEGAVTKINNGSHTTLAQTIGAFISMANKVVYQSCETTEVTYDRKQKRYKGVRIKTIRTPSSSCEKPQELNPRQAQTYFHKLQTIFLSKTPARIAIQ